MIKNIIKENSVDIQFDCTCLHDGSVHREIVSISSDELAQPDFITYLRELIEVKLSIPIICQVSLSLGDVCLDPITDNIYKFPKRMCRQGERIPIYLQYHSKTIKLQEIKQLVKEFSKTVENKEYRTLYNIMHYLNHDLMNVGPGGWGSESALCARLYLKHCGFLSELKSLLVKIFDETYENFNKLTNTPHECSNDPTLNSGDYFSQINTLHDNSASRCLNSQVYDLIAQLDSCQLAITGILAFIWNFGALWEDRIYLKQSGFFKYVIHALQLSEQLKYCPNVTVSAFGKNIYDKAIGVLDGLVELKELGIEIGTDINLMTILGDALYNCRVSSIFYQSMEELVLSLIFFSASAHNAVTRLISYHKIYDVILYKYSTMTCVSPYSHAVLYNIGMFCLHLLKTPYLVISDLALKNILSILEAIIFNANITRNAEFERNNGYLWGSLEPFLSFFVKPSNCFIKYIENFDKSYPEIQFVEYYDKMALYILDVTLESERNRQQLIEEGLLPYFLIVSWRVPGLIDRLRLFYPEYITKVPKLKQIATISYGFQYEGYFYARNIDC